MGNVCSVLLLALLFQSETPEGSQHTQNESSITMTTDIVGHIASFLSETDSGRSFRGVSKQWNQQHIENYPVAQKVNSLSRTMQLVFDQVTVNSWMDPAECLVYINQLKSLKEQNYRYTLHPKYLLEIPRLYHALHNDNRQQNAMCIRQVLDHYNYGECPISIDNYDDHRLKWHRLMAARPRIVRLVQVSRHIIDDLISNTLDVTNNVDTNLYKFAYRAMWNRAASESPVLGYDENELGDSVEEASMPRLPTYEEAMRLYQHAELFADETLLKHTKQNLFDAYGLHLIHPHYLRIPANFSADFLEMLCSFHHFDLSWPGCDDELSEEIIFYVLEHSRIPNELYYDELDELDRAAFDHFMSHLVAMMYRLQTYNEALEFCQKLKKFNALPLIDQDLEASLLLSQWFGDS